jgi:hypothetical protein
MAITPGYTSSTDATEVEQEYIDKGAVTTPQVNPEVDRKYMEARAEAEKADYVEWPTKVAGQTGEWA